MHYVYRHTGLRSNHIHRLQLYWQTDPKMKIVASDFVWCCRILSAIECTCIEMILSCPGKGYRVGTPIVAPNYVKLQMAIKKKQKKHYMQWKSYDLYQIGTVCTTEYTANQHSFIHTLYQCTVPPPHALQGLWSSYSYKNAVGIVVPGTYSHSCTTQLLGLPDNFI